MNVANITARTILNSRGTWTLEAGVSLSDGSYGVASVPEGISKGRMEAVSVPAEKAVENILSKLRQHLIGTDSLDQAEFDARMRELDGTSDKSSIGANTLLAVSLAFAKATAHHFRIPLWKHIRNISHAEFVRPPRLLMNVINGGLHAGNSLQFQEYIVIPSGKTVLEALSNGVDFYNELRTHLSKHNGVGSTLVGDEGGFGGNFMDPLRPFEVFDTISKKLHLTGHITYGLDAAGTNVSYDNDTRFELYRRMKEHHPLRYLEDPYGEDDLTSHRHLLEGVRGTVDIVGDDSTVTQSKNIIMAHSKKALSGVIIKANQVGTLTETLESIHTARNFGMSIYTSHRSGETNDTWVADLTWGVCADGVKLGAPARGERVTKYNRLLEIEGYEHI